MHKPLDFLLHVPAVRFRYGFVQFLSARRYVFCVRGNTTRKPPRVLWVKGCSLTSHSLLLASSKNSTLSNLF